MPDVEFLEKFPLYTKFKSHQATKALNDIAKVNINMSCEKCKEIRTFNMVNDYSQNIPTFRISYFTMGFSSPTGADEKEARSILFLEYLCASCKNFFRYFVIRRNENMGFFQKIGQYPPREITIEKELNDILSDLVVLYKKGLMNESFNHGIGAFAYYRRIIEDIINNLLEIIPDLMNGEEKEVFLKALEKIKTTKQTDKKIALVKDLLPPILMPEGFNPLKTLYDILSEGIHGKSDEECLEKAILIRETLNFIVKKTLQSKKEQIEFTEKMKSLLKKTS